LEVEVIPKHPLTLEGVWEIKKADFSFMAKLKFRKTRQTSGDKHLFEGILTDQALLLRVEDGIPKHPLATNSAKSKSLTFIFCFKLL
jgi:hypothetical protein